MAIIVCVCAVVSALIVAEKRPVGNDTGLGVQLPSPAQYQYLRVSILGDEFSIGVGSSNLDGYSKRIANQLCWNIDRVAESSTGYVNPGPGGDRSFTNFARLEAIRGTGPELVIVQGSANDSNREGVGVAAAEAFSAIRAGSPNATLVVVGPTAPPALDSVSIGNVRDELQTAALAAGATFIDPIDRGWLRDEAQYGGSGLVPTDAGYSEYADELRTALNESGVLTRDTCAPTNR